MNKEASYLCVEAENGHVLRLVVTGAGRDLFGEGRWIERGRKEQGIN